MDSKAVLKRDRLAETCNAKVQRIGQRLYGVTDPTWHLHTFPLVTFWTMLLLAVVSFMVLSKTTNVSPFWFQLLYLGILGGSIVGYFYFYLTQFEECAVLADPMNKRLFSLYGFPISTWPLSHFLLWLAATVMAPSSWSYYLVTGLVWEGVELLMKTMAKETTLSRTARTRVGETGEYTYLTYWESTWEDIVINSAGIATGLLISRQLPYDAAGVLTLFEKTI